MGVLLGLAPLILFALLTSLSVSLALWAALAASFVIGIRDFVQMRSVRLLDAGGILLFALVALYAGFIQPSLSTQAVRLIVEGGLLLLMLVSLVRRNPFTLDYARENVPQEQWNTPQFLRANYVLTSVWAGALALMAVTDLVATFLHDVPLSLDFAANLAALGAAIIFTVRYPLQATHS